MKLIASWDDGPSSDLIMAELMAKYNIPTIFYWPSFLEKAKQVNDFLSPEGRKEISNRFEIGSHSATHQPMNKMSIPLLGIEITESRKQLQDITGQSIDTFAYPKQSQNSLIRALLKGAGYKSARTSVIGHLKPGEDLFQVPCTVQIGIDRIEYREKCWELFADEMLESTDPESVFHIFGNSMDVTKNNDWENLELLIKKCI